MTALNISQIPSSVDTLEKLVAWGGLVLADMYPTVTGVEDTGSATRAAQSTPFLVSATSTPTWRLVNRTSLQLNANWRRQGKLWLQVIDLGNAAIPSEFLT